MQLKMFLLLGIVLPSCLWGDLLIQNIEPLSCFSNANAIETLCIITHIFFLYHTSDLVFPKSPAHPIKDIQGVAPETLEKINVGVENEAPPIPTFELDKVLYLAENFFLSVYSSNDEYESAIYFGDKC